TVTAPDITDPFSRVFHQKGTATSPVNVVALPPGVNIVATNPVNSDNIQPLTLNNQFLNFLVGSFPTTIQLVGEVVDFPRTAVFWTATDSSGNTTVIGVGNTVNWTVPSPGGIFTISMV